MMVIGKSKKRKTNTKKQSSVASWKGKTSFAFTVNCSLTAFYIRVFKKWALKNFLSVNCFKKEKHVLHFSFCFEQEKSI